MQIVSVWLSLKRKSAGALLIAVQMAVTLAILANALHIVQQRLVQSRRPTGVDESSIVVVSNQWIDNTDLAARQEADIAALRSTPGVADAYPTNSVPLSGSGSTWPMKLQAFQEEPTAMAAAYYVDEHGWRTLGLRMVAGRGFNADEIVKVGSDQQLTAPAVIVVTKVLATRLFPDDNAVGRSVFIQPGVPTRIIGVVEQLQVPWVAANGWGSTFSENSVLVPFWSYGKDGLYVVRTQPGKLNSVLRSVQQRLRDVSRERVISRVFSLDEARGWVYHDDRGLAILLSSICALLLTVTAFGIVGLTSYWVAQRWREIGIRRALGATRGSVVGYFQTENLLIAMGACAVGVGLALAVNIWMVRSFQMARLDAGYPLVGSVAIVLLGQLAALWPAVRAASVPPAIAARST